MEAKLINDMMERMAAFEDRLHQSSLPAATVTSISVEFAAFRLFITQSVSNLQKQMEIVSRESDQLEVQGQRNLLLSDGVTETKEEDTAGLATSCAGFDFIEIYLYNNGQTSSAPMRYVLNVDQLSNWDRTVYQLGQAQYGSEAWKINLYNKEGKKVNSPLELINGASYVAVKQGERFVKPDYFLDKADPLRYPVNSYNMLSANRTVICGMLYKTIYTAQSNYRMGAPQDEGNKQNTCLTRSLKTRGAFQKESNKIISTLINKQDFCINNVGGDRYNENVGEYFKSPEDDDSVSDNGAIPREYVIKFPGEPNVVITSTIDGYDSSPKTEDEMNENLHEHNIECRFLNGNKPDETNNDDEIVCLLKINDKVISVSNKGDLKKYKINVAIKKPSSSL